MAKAERSSQNIRCRTKKEKKNVDIPDMPNFLLDIPYGILTPYVSVSNVQLFINSSGETQIPRYLRCLPSEQLLSKLSIVQQWFMILLITLLHFRDLLVINDILCFTLNGLRKIDSTCWFWRCSWQIAALVDSRLSSWKRSSWAGRRGSVKTVLESKIVKSIKVVNHCLRGLELLILFLFLLVALWCAI